MLRSYPVGCCVCSEAPDIQEEAFTEGCGGAIYLTCCIFGSVIPCSMLLCRFSFFFSIDVRGIVGWVRSNGVKGAQATGGYSVEWACAEVLLLLRGFRVVRLQP